MDLKSASQNTIAPATADCNWQNTLYRKVLDMYKAGAPISVISEITGLPKDRINKLVDQVQLSREELTIRNQLLNSYTQNTQARILKRQEARTNIELNIVENMSEQYKDLMNSGFKKVASFMADADISSLKEVPMFLSIMERSHDLWERFNEAIAKRDMDMLATVINQFELEQTETITQMGLQGGPIALNKDGTRPELKEDSASRTITLKLKKKGVKPEEDTNNR